MLNVTEDLLFGVRGWLERENLRNPAVDVELWPFMYAGTYLIFFEVPTGNALLAIIDALYSAAFDRKAETSFLAIRNSSRRFSTLVVTSSALTYKMKL